jgi:hypothetical protein
MRSHTGIYMKTRGCAVFKVSPEGVARLLQTTKFSTHSLEYCMKKLTTTVFAAALLASTGLAVAQGTQQQSGQAGQTGSVGNAQSGHKNTGGNPVPGLGLPSAGTPGSTGGAHTPGTSASGATVKCPQRTMEATNGSNSNLGTGRQPGPKLSKNRPTSASTFCEDEVDTAAAPSGTNGDATASRNPGSSGTPATSGASAKEGTAQSGKK